MFFFKVSEDDIERNDLGVVIQSVKKQVRKSFDLFFKHLIEKNRVLNKDFHLISFLIINESFFEFYPALITDFAELEDGSKQQWFTTEYYQIVMCVLYECIQQHFPKCKMLFLDFTTLRDHQYALKFPLYKEIMLYSQRKSLFYNHTPTMYYNKPNCLQPHLRDCASLMNVFGFIGLGRSDDQMDKQQTKRALSFVREYYEEFKDIFYNYARNSRLLQFGVRSNEWVKSGWSSINGVFFDEEALEAHISKMFMERNYVCVSENAVYPLFQTQNEYLLECIKEFRYWSNRSHVFHQSPRNHKEYSSPGSANNQHWEYFIKNKLKNMTNLSCLSLKGSMSDILLCVNEYGKISNITCLNFVIWPELNCWFDTKCLGLLKYYLISLDKIRLEIFCPNPERIKRGFYAMLRTKDIQTSKALTPFQQETFLICRQTLEQLNSDEVLYLKTIDSLHSSFKKCYHLDQFYIAFSESPKDIICSSDANNYSNLDSCSRSRRSRRSRLFKSYSSDNLITTSKVDRSDC